MNNIIKESKRGNLVVISGPSGCGKGTVLKEVLKNYPNSWLSISCTSREKRVGEIENVSYYYLTKEEFEKRIKEDYFLEYAKYADNYYGTPKEKIEEKLQNGIDVFLEIEIEGALKIKEKVKEAIFIFIMPPSIEELKNRLIGRGTENKDKILKRFKNAYKEINQIKNYNYVVVNDEIDIASTKIISILTSERCRVDRIEDVYLNSEEEAIHELLMDELFVNREIDIK